VRITARLIDAESGSQQWSEHYDRDLVDIFAVQDEIVHAIVATLPGRIDAAGMRLARRKRPENLTAYDHYLRGFECSLTMNRADEPAARQWYEKALDSDPDLAIAYSMTAVLHMRDWYFELSSADLERALVLARKGAGLDPNDGRCQGILGGVQLYRKQLDEAAFHLQRALTLNPSDTFMMVSMGWLAVYRGRPGDGLDWMSRALRLNPYPPPWFATSQAMAFYGLHRYEEAAAILARESDRDAWMLAYLLACYGQLGRSAEARACDAKFREQRPQLSLLQVAAIEPYENAADLDHLLSGLRKAGVSP
jgi:tetratricopeptide (TPR) repeat protein